MASSSALKRKLSGSTDGMRISVSAVGPTGTVLHTAVAGTTPGTYDEIWIDGHNVDTTIHTLVLEFGGSGATNEITLAIPPQAGLVWVVDGRILQNGKVVRAYADEADKVTCGGHVHAVTD